MFRILSFLCFLFIITPSIYPSDEVRVSIFNGQSLSAIVVSSEKGSYTVQGDGREVFVIEENDIVYVSRRGDSLFIGSNSGTSGVFSHISLISLAGTNGFSIMPVQTSAGKMHYHGSLQLNVRYGRISMINEIDKTLYLAGVVEAEAGNGASPVYYMAQSVICRTYLYGNLHRHADEGFDLCDEVHCQVYKGRMSDNKVIMEAVAATTGKVIVCREGRLITAAFHANCGGQTASSEDVWLLPRAYLRPVTDPWCRGRPGYSWQVAIDADRWRTYLEEMGYKRSGSGGSPDVFRSAQESRRTFYQVGDFTLPYRKIRSDWNFRSAWFNTDSSGDGRQILIRGRGYGHGVGLCQEGAMQMAAKGYTCEDILKFYYTGIDITNIDKLF
jgi:stage II sporulation protein D